ncbi:MAG: helix-turn-helix transcriptional regulator, partial [Clostridia bacterium]|nr:helix-turn-helix transcriptional regulator [Clostridia bacterium]
AKVMTNIELWKQRKKELKLSYDELSKLSGIPKTTLTNIFLGTTPNPRFDTVQAIERALGIAEEPTTALTANESFIQEYGSLFTDEYFIRYTKIYNLLNREQRIFIIGYLIAGVEQFGVKVSDVS